MGEEHLSVLRRGVAARELLLERAERGERVVALDTTPVVKCFHRYAGEVFALRVDAHGGYGGRSMVGAGGQESGTETRLGPREANEPERARGRVWALQLHVPFVMCCCGSSAAAFPTISPAYVLTFVQNKLSLWTAPSHNLLATEDDSTP